MFVYQKNGKLCITFDDNKPVTNPAINFDLENQKLIVNDSVIEPIVADELTADVVLSTAEIVTTAKTVVLNNHTISAPQDTVGDGIYCVKKGGYLTINGDGVINGVGNNDYNMAVWANGGHVVINGGTFTNKGASATVDSDHFDLIYAKDNGIVEINGGFFECETPRWTLNNHNTKPGKIVVRGGSFVGFNPAEAYTDDNGDSSAVNYVAEGYKVTCKDNIYTVTKI